MTRFHMDVGQFLDLLTHDRIAFWTYLGSRLDHHSKLAAGFLEFFAAVESTAFF